MSGITGRSKELDIAKGVGIILMVIGHSSCPRVLYGIIYSFHMVLFFLIAGMNYNYNKWNQLGIRKLIRKRAKSYLLPYILLSLSNLVLNGINELETIKDKKSGLMHNCVISDGLFIHQVEKMKIRIALRYGFTMYFFSIYSFLGGYAIKEARNTNSALLFAYCG